MSSTADLEKERVLGDDYIRINTIDCRNIPERDRFVYRPLADSWKKKLRALIDRKKNEA